MARNTYLRIYSAMSAVVGIALLVFYFWHEWRLLLYPDSRGYLVFADAIADGSVLQPLKFDDRNLSRLISLAVRTPLYPALLAAAGAGTGANYGSILCLHLALGLSGLAVLYLGLRHKLGFGAALCAAGFSLPLALPARIFSCVLCEWPAVILVLSLAGALPRAIESGRGGWLIYTSIAAMLLVLLKPVFLMVVLPLWVVLLFAHLKSMRCLLGPFLVCFVIPLLGWASFNFYRQGAFSISPYGKFALFGVAALIGHTFPQRGDSRLQNEFDNYVNERKFPRIAEEEDYLTRLAAQYFQFDFNHNLWEVAAQFRTEHSLEWGRLNELCGSYALRAIQAYPLRYLEYVFEGIKRGTDGIFIVLCLLAACILSGRRGQMGRPLAFSGVALCCMHLIMVTGSSAAVVFLPRYEAMTVIGPCALVFVLAFIELETALGRIEGADRMQ